METMNPRCHHEQLLSDLNPAYHIRSEGESLAARLIASRFRLVRRLGAGAMRVVHEAYDRQRNELVALKTMRLVDPSTLIRFKHEFRSSSDITHPNLIKVYELVAVENHWFYTTELLEGCDFVAYVRAPASLITGQDGALDALDGSLEGPMAQPSYSRHTASRLLVDETRLRDALRQLAEGVEALHQKGKLHLDIKPTNMIATTKRRVVLLDFGPAIDLGPSGKHKPKERKVFGSMAYTSPEQAAGHSITAASDRYSVGATLYPAMTGQLPFGGTYQEVEFAKQTVVPPSPESVVTGLPEDLTALCVELLDRRPACRPTGEEIIARLGANLPRALRHAKGIRPLPPVGRSGHLQALKGVFASSVCGTTESIFIVGRAGTGKTTLVRSFLDDLAKEELAVVLTGRCYEREWVPYKALDSLIDALARYLRELPAREVRKLLPERIGLLASVFPALQSVGTIAAARRNTHAMPSQQELRRHAFDGLHGLLARLGERGPLVVAIDDLHWGDVDSALLLLELIRSPQSPVSLFVGCFRSEDSEKSRFLRETRNAFDTQPVVLASHELIVGRLSRSQERKLACPEHSDSATRARAQIEGQRARGNPTYILKLAKDIGGSPDEAARGVKLLGTGKIDRPTARASETARPSVGISTEAKVCP
jgi:serine/threonine protein kinase